MKVGNQLRERFLLIGCGLSISGGDYDIRRTRTGVESTDESLGYHFCHRLYVGVVVLHCKDGGRIGGEIGIVGGMDFSDGCFFNRYVWIAHLWLLAE
ncbi:MAG: hypothetical protein V1716_01915 [Candidatus Uhrbacteria bacterium]